MKVDLLAWMNERYPRGFYCAEIPSNISSVQLSAIISLNAPVLFHLQKSQLQELIALLFENGASPELVCQIPEENVSGTIGDIALKTRNLRSSDIFLVLSE